MPPAPIETAGIVLGPGADLATIGAGEHEVETRNVFTNSEVRDRSHRGLEDHHPRQLHRARTGWHRAATLENGIVVNDGLTSKAEETEVGGLLSSTETATPACDGACNAIVTDGGSGITIDGETAGLGHRSVIRGNLTGWRRTG